VDPCIVDNEEVSFNEVFFVDKEEDEGEEIELGVCSFIQDDLKWMLLLRREIGEDRY